MYSDNNDNNALDLYSYTLIYVLYNRFSFTNIKQHIGQFSTYTDI